MKRRISLCLSMTVCVCVYLCLSACTRVGIYWYILSVETYTHNWNGDHICCVYMHATWSTTHTCTLFINVLFSINNFSSFPTAANKHYFLIVSIYNLLINSWIFIILMYVTLELNPLPRTQRLNHMSYI